MFEAAFYVMENITGYTGSLFSNPTVYFRKGNKFGRITQSHPDPTNIGRNKVRVASDYRIYNTAAGQAEEFYHGKAQHSSRNAYRTANNFDVLVLSKAIQLFPNKKSK